jgi:hypothetical protein
MDLPRWWDDALLAKLPPAFHVNHNVISRRRLDDPFPRQVPLGVGDTGHLFEASDRIAYVIGILEGLFAKHLKRELPVGNGIAGFGG